MFAMYPGASNFVHDVDLAFYIILGISFFFMLLITFLMILFIYKYNKKRHKVAVQIKEKVYLEVTWILIPLALVLLMFYYGWRGYFPMREVPEDAMVVKTTGQMWQWTFEYPNGKISQDLILPINKAVKLDLISTDVIHGLSIPAFRVKEDVVPGKYNYTWFIPQKIGDYDIFCSAYCGVRHSYMHSYVKVVTEEEYQKLLAELPEKPVAEAGDGLSILQANGCVGCHSLDGTIILGPSFKGLWGSQHIVTTEGSERNVTVDEDYIKNSIYDPNKDIVKGYSAGLMKSYSDIIKEDEIVKVTEYLKTLK